MNPLTIRSAVLAAEHRLAQSRHEARARVARVRSAIRRRLAQPSSLSVATGIGVLLGMWITHRHKARPAPDSSAASLPLAGLVSAFLIRFAVQRLADAWMGSRASAPQRSGTNDSAMR